MRSEAAAANDDDADRSRDALTRGCKAFDGDGCRDDSHHAEDPSRRRPAGSPSGWRNRVRTEARVAGRVARRCRRSAGSRDAGPGASRQHASWRAFQAVNCSAPAISTTTPIASGTARDSAGSRISIVVSATPEREGRQSEQGPDEEVPHTHERGQPTRSSSASSARPLRRSSTASARQTAASSPPSSRPTCR